MFRCNYSRNRKIDEKFKITKKARLRILSTKNKAKKWASTRSLQVLERNFLLLPKDNMGHFQLYLLKHGSKFDNKLIEKAEISFFRVLLLEIQSKNLYIASAVKSKKNNQPNFSSNPVKIKQSYRSYFQHIVLQIDKKRFFQINSKIKTFSLEF